VLGQILKRIECGQDENIYIYDNGVEKDWIARRNADK
jgi:hypothetical protein